MKRTTELPELLCPAGSMEALYAAVKGGADAVYIGGKKFGARAFAKNFELEEIREAVIYCHLHGVKLYAAVNTLIYDRELDEAYAYCEELYKLGVDALIVCDLGLISLLREGLPDFELHASTQMGIHNREGADFAYSLGLGRVVLARECSGKDIAKICEESLSECEIFVHGALCVCHSGQCLFSSMVGGRSGNRGECAQPCRLPFGKGYPLSLRDLSLAKHIPEIISSGAASLKIEGRMKSPDYVYKAASVFRRLLDEGRAATDGELRELSEVFSRSGFTDGYFVGRLKSNMTGVRSREDKLRTKEQSPLEFHPERRAVRASLLLERDTPSRLGFTLDINERCGGKRETLTAFVEGASPETARSSPLTEADVASRIGKLGSTPFTLDGGELTVSLADGINLSPSELNSLRRRAAELLCSRLLRPIRERRKAEGEIDFVKINRAPLRKAEKMNTAVFYNANKYFEIIGPRDSDFFDIVFLPLSGFTEGRTFDTERLGVCIPPVIMERERKEVREELSRVRSLGIKYALVSNIGHINLARELDFTPVGDFRLNISNLRSRALLSSFGINDAILSPELTPSMAKDIGGGIIVQGRIPLMLTERCFISENFGCGACSAAKLTDRYNESFPMMKEYGHRNLIFNSCYTYMGDKKSELDSRGLSHRHFIFSTESVEEARFMLDSYRSGARLSIPVRRIGKR